MGLTSRLSRALYSGVTMKMRRFSRDEDGAVIIFAVVIFVLMLIMGGLAVDMARTESHRVKMQSTLDRAVLAAADLDNTQDPKKVVEDYFAKAGLTSALTKVTVDPAFNGKYVKAEAREQVKTAFLHMVGVDSLTAPSAGAAQEMIANIEISLVVDVSGSMNGSRMNNLKTAAENFFYAVMDNGPNKPGLTSVSIIPYNAHVNFGSVLANRVNLEKRHNFSYCARFREDNVRDDFTTTAITKDTFIEREAHFYYEDNSVNYDYPPANDFWCRSDDNRTVMVHETDPAKLTTHIKSFWADGWTAVDQGMKVGAALLDPAFDDVIEKMADEKEIPLEVKGRPAPFTDDETMKIIVLMTDGANTVQRDLPDFAKTTMSPVWWSQSAANSGGAWYDGFYVDLNYEATPQNELVPGNRDWYRPRSPWSRNDDQWMGWHGRSDAVRLSYQDLMMEFVPNDLQKMMWRWADYPSRNWKNQNARPKIWDWHRHDELFGVHTNASKADQQTRDFCDLINDSDRNIQIFTIAFQAPTAGENLMSHCATTSGHYYDVSTLDINNAFNSIASQINHLRLVQ